MTSFRIGSGYDVHALVLGRPLILGGVNIPFDRGLAGHSDADVLFHAVADCLLGASAMGDMGTIFPSDDHALSGMDSGLLLKKVIDLVWAEGYRLGNMDCTIIAEKPRLAPHIPAMRENLVRYLETDMALVSVKATTTDGLGVFGRSEGIAARTTVLLEIP